MDGALVKVEACSDLASVRLSPSLASKLGLKAGARIHLRFGCGAAEARVKIRSSVAPGTLRLSPDLRKRLQLPWPSSLTAVKMSDSQVVLGPLIGLLIAESKLHQVRQGRRDTVYCRYSRAATEAGAILFFFAADGVAANGKSVTGYVHRCHPDGACTWEEVRFPFPYVIYDRCFTSSGRDQSSRVRRIARSMGSAVLNSLPKLTKLQTFAALKPLPSLSPHVPFTAPFSGDMLARAMKQSDDLYLKPNALYKGKGIYRLTRQGAGWLLQSREEHGNVSRFIPSAEETVALMERLLPEDAHYLVQEGLPLVRYLGNRFDFRSFVQKDGRGRWQVTGVAARVAPEESIITSPRSGGQVALADRALRHAFPDRGRVSCPICTASLFR